MEYQMKMNSANPGIGWLYGQENETFDFTTESESESDRESHLEFLKYGKKKEALCSSHLLPATWEPLTLPRRNRLEVKPATPKKIKILKPIRLTKAGIISQLNMAKRLENQLKALNKSGTRRISLSKKGQDRAKRAQERVEIGVERGSGLSKTEFFQFKTQPRNTVLPITPMDKPSEFFWQPYSGFVDQIHGGDFEELTEQDVLDIGQEVFCSKDLANAMELVENVIDFDPTRALLYLNPEDTINATENGVEIPDFLSSYSPQGTDHNYAFSRITRSRSKVDLVGQA